MIDETESQLHTKQRRQFRSLIEEHKRQFMLKDGDIGRTKLVQHEINTAGSRTHQIMTKREAYRTQQTVQQEVEKMLAQDVIEPPTSAWTLPVVLLKKKEGTSRFCIDDQRLNDVKVKDE